MLSHPHRVSSLSGLSMDSHHTHWMPRIVVEGVGLTYQGFTLESKFTPWESLTPEPLLITPSCLWDRQSMFGHGNHISLVWSCLLLHKGRT